MEAPNFQGSINVALNHDRQVVISFPEKYTGESLLLSPQAATKLAGVLLATVEQSRVKQ